MSTVRRSSASSARETAPIVRAGPRAGERHHDLGEALGADIRHGVALVERAKAVQLGAGD